MQQRHVREDPLVARARYAEVTFEQRVQTVQEELDTVSQINNTIYYYICQQEINIIYKRNFVRQEGTHEHITHTPVSQVPDLFEVSSLSYGPEIHRMLWSTSYPPIHKKRHVHVCPLWSPKRLDLFIRPRSSLDQLNGFSYLVTIGCLFTTDGKITFSSLRTK